MRGRHALEETGSEKEILEEYEYVRKFVAKLLASSSLQREDIEDIGGNIFKKWLDEVRPEFAHLPHDQLMKILGTRVYRDVLDRRKQKSLPIADVALDLIPLRDMLDPESLIILYQVAARLQPLQQQILDLWLEEFAIPEIAEALAIPESRVKRERNEIKIALTQALK